MGLTKQICYTLDCDDCGQSFELDEGLLHAKDFAEAMKWLGYDPLGWRTDGRGVLCGGCTDKPHPFRLKPDTTSECWRCDEPADEHLASDGPLPVPVADGQLAICEVVS